MQSTLVAVFLLALIATVFTQQDDEMSADKRMRSFAFAKRSPYRAFAFAKRSDEDFLDDDESQFEKRARFAFAKRGYRSFAKRRSPYGFAFAKRGFNSFA